MNCYSNGIREIPTPVDGGTLVVFTKPDGVTECYQVLIDASGEHYLRPSGQEVALVTTRGGVYSVTCDGMTKTVDFTDPTCALLTETACSATGDDCGPPAHRGHAP
jgi:hypothetical protein